MADSWNKYANTAARTHGRPGREVRPQTTTIDIHSHIAVPAAAKYAQPHLDPRADLLASFASKETQALNAQQGAARAGVMTQHDERLKDMDDQGVDMQLVM